MRSLKFFVFVVLVLCFAGLPTCAQDAPTRQDWIDTGWPAHLIPVQDLTKEWPNQYDANLCRFLWDMRDTLTGRTAIKVDGPLKEFFDKPDPKIKELPNGALASLKKFAHACAVLATDFSQYHGSEQPEWARILRHASEQVEMRRKPPTEAEFNDILKAAEERLDGAQGKSQETETLAARSTQQLVELAATEYVLTDVLDRFVRLHGAAYVIMEIRNEQDRRSVELVAAHFKLERNSALSWKTAYQKLQEQTELLEKEYSKVQFASASRTGFDWATILAGINSTLTEIQRTRERQEMEQQQRWQNYHLWVIGDELGKRNRPPF